mgnify:FL=1
MLLSLQTSEIIECQAEVCGIDEWSPPIAKSVTKLTPFVTM